MPVSTGTQKRLRVDSHEPRRTKCCESDSYSATHLCWVFTQPTLSRQRAVKAGGVALLQASMANFNLLKNENFLNSI